MKLQPRLAALLTLYLLVSCSAPKQTSKEDGSLHGTVYSVGNEPFTKLGLSTTDGTTYILKCPKEIEQILNSRQGKTVSLRYERIEQLPEGLTLVVTGIE